MDKNDIIEYVMNTPHNTNKAVLSSMLNQLAEDGGSGSNIVHPVQVTIVNNTADTVNFTSVASNDDMTSGYIGGFYISDHGIIVISPNTRWIPSLLKDTTTVLSLAYCLDDGVIYIADSGDNRYTYTLSENATKTNLEDMDVIVVTGDCTITVA